MLFSLLLSSSLLLLLPTLSYGTTGVVTEEKYPIGTEVYFEFIGDAWYYGTITSHPDDETYVVTWDYEDEFDNTDEYRYDDQELDIMVKQAIECKADPANYCGTQKYVYGTPVSLEVDEETGKKMNGEVTEYDGKGTYTITWWDDVNETEGDKQDFRYDDPALQDMVKAADWYDEPTSEPTSEPSAIIYDDDDEEEYSDYEQEEYGDDTVEEEEEEEEYDDDTVEEEYAADAAEEEEEEEEEENSDSAIEEEEEEQAASEEEEEPASEEADP